VRVDPSTLAVDPPTHTTTSLSTGISRQPTAKWTDYLPGSAGRPIQKK
jgi:hypothetical protein